MPKIERAHLVWGLCGYLMTTLLLADLLPLEGLTRAQGFGLFTIALAIPFLLSLTFVSKLFGSEFKIVRTPLHAIRTGIFGGATLVVFVSLFASIEALIYSVFGGDSKGINAIGSIVMLPIIVLGALVYAAIPILIFGTGLGLWVYSNNKNRVEPEVN